MTKLYLMDFGPEFIRFRLKKLLIYNIYLLQPIGDSVVKCDRVAKKGLVFLRCCINLML